MKKFIFIFLIANTLLLLSQWEPSYKGLPNDRVSCMVNKGNYLFAGFFNSGIYLSTDNGNSWLRRNSGLTDTTVKCLACQGNILLAGTSMGGVFSSSDNGTTWVQRYFKWQECFNAIAVSDSLIIAGAQGQGSNGDIFVSKDGGLNWTQKKSITTNMISSLAVIGNTIFAGTVKGIGGLFISTDGGENWTSKFIGTKLIGVPMITINGSNIYIYSDGLGLFKSTDSGDNWKELNNGILSNKIFSYLITDNNILYGTTNYVYISKDDGFSWKLIKIGLPAFQITLVSYNDDYIFAGLWGGGLFRAKKSNLIPKLKPFISKINDVTINKNSFTNVNFEFVGEEPNNLKFMISASDTNLIPPGNTQIHGSDSEQTLTIKPTKRGYGTCEITIIAVDGTDSAFSKFKLTVLNTRIKPSISTISDILIDTATMKDATVDFQIDGNILDSLKITIKTGNSELLPFDSIQLTGTGENRKLTITPSKGKTGDCVVTIIVTDGIDSAGTAFNVKVGQFTGLNDTDPTHSETLIYPNPTNDFIEITGLEPAITSEIHIYNVIGEMVLNVGVRHAEPVGIDISSLPAGLYYLQAGPNRSKFIKIK